MIVTKLYNKITLREHPDLSPVDDPSFSKGHSFIFPGDELVMCTQIDAPTDLGGADWSGRSLSSVKVSIIAKKPNVFSEEFSRQFASTRSFELDSFTIPLDSVNAPVVPWGADGYAPNINFTQDRNWQLPAGDFKRQIKMFTTHQSGTTSWKYNFWFPFIFNESYWLALAAADNDFYDVLEPQNGKNQKWLNYHNLAALPFGWQIFMKFELVYNYMSPLARYAYPFIGDPYKIVSEYSLSNEVTGIQDYESNPDYNALEIKTCAVNGTPSVARLILGYQNTSCFGYFSKLTAWDANEKDYISAEFRIRPLEGGDRLGSRASSKFDITTDVVWAENKQPISTSDADVDIDTDLGVSIITSDSGNGVLIAFDVLDDKNIIIQSEIDYQKLALIFPGVTQFTLYCRLYNGTILLAQTKTSVGTLNITGDQYMQDSSGGNYDVAGIPAGFTYDSIQLPEGWGMVSRTVLSPTDQRFNLATGVGSGTIVIIFKSGAYTQTALLDVYVDAKRMGEEITRNAVLIPNPPFPHTPINPCGDDSDCPNAQLDCPFVLDVFADVNALTNDLHNDKSDFYGRKYMGNAGLSAITMVLQKNRNECGCDWEDKYTFIEEGGGQTPTASLYGKFFAFGHTPDFTGLNYTDDFGNKYTGLLLDWLLVLQAFGTGQYRMKITYTSAIDGTTIDDYDVRVFCLKQWNCFNINNTVRIETTNSGFRGTMEDNTLQIDYYTGWKGQLRVKGIFYEVKPNYNKEFNQYGDADYNALKPIIHELVPKFDLDVKPHPGWMDWVLSNYVILSDEILITDYNGMNRKIFVKTPVQNEGGIDTKDDDLVNGLAWSKISFTYGQNNLRRRND